MSEPRILNIRDLGPRAAWPADVVRVDRKSAYGNPFKIGARCRWNPVFADSRRDTIDHYLQWLNDQLVVHPQFLEPLRGKRLACWCTPEDCHARLILEWLDSHPVAP